MCTGTRCHPSVPTHVCGPCSRCCVHVCMHADARETQVYCSVLYACCCSCNLNVVTRNPVLFRLLFTLLHSRPFSSLLSAFLSLSLHLSSLRNQFSPLPRAACAASLRFPRGELVLYSGVVKITLFLYNAHIHRSYCNLVRSRSRVIGGKKYFHGCGTPAVEAKKKERERERERVVRPRGNLLGRKSRAAINSPLKRNRSGTF